MATGVSYGGVAQLIVMGTSREMAGSFKSTPGGIGRTPAIGPSGPTGNWVENWAAAEIEAELWDDPQVSVTDLAQQTGGTIQVNLNNGKTWVLRNSFVVDGNKIQVADGKFTIKWSGLFQELPSS